MRNIKIVQNEIFAEELTIANVANCKGADISFQDGKGWKMSIREVKEQLAQKIKESALKEKESTRGSHYGRYKTADLKSAT